MSSNNTTAFAVGSKVYSVRPHRSGGGVWQAAKVIRSTSKQSLLEFSNGERLWVRNLHIALKKY